MGQGKRYTSRPTVATSPKEIMENLITAYDLALTEEWLDETDFNWAIVGKSKKRNDDGTTYRLLVTCLRNPINIIEAADLCSDTDKLSHWI